MAKTVTLKRARRGRSAVQVGETTFPLGEPVRDVDDATLDRLKQVPGVEVHVTGPKQPTTDKPGGQTP